MFVFEKTDFIENQIFKKESLTMLIDKQNSKWVQPGVQLRGCVVWDGSAMTP